MRFFANDVQDKYVMSSDGKYLGTVDNLVVDTKSGKVLHILVIPSEEVDIRKFRMDSQDRLVLPFNKVKSIKDVIIMSALDLRMIDIGLYFGPGMGEYEVRRTRNTQWFRAGSFTCSDGSDTGMGEGRKIQSYQDRRR